MERASLKVLIFSIFSPWLLATIFQSAPATSFLLAWLGSFFIFYQTWFSSYKYILPDLPAYKQIMRPLFLQQLIFAGFMCCTSIFFFTDTIGYRYSEQVNFFDADTIDESVALIAKCQRLALLGHASLVTGILLVQRSHQFDIPGFRPSSLISIEVWLLRVGFASLLLSLIMQRLPGLAQFSISLYNAALFCGAVLFVRGIVERNVIHILWGGSIFVFNIINSTISGFKEPIIINFIIITCLLFPFYKKLIIFLALPVFIGLFYVLSIYTNVFRQHAWDGETTAEEARTEAFDTVLDEYDQEPLQETNWEFLTTRFSEIGMFTKYIQSTPDIVPYYHLDILENSILSIIPRALWSNKPITEEVAMERVYLADVVDRRSNVSAKSRPIVDGYLSGGMVGVFLYMLFIGSISQLLSNKAENMFGGYAVGCVIFFNGCFQLLWRGEAMEFLINSIFWSFISMMLLFVLLRHFNYLVKIEPGQRIKHDLNENHPG